MFAPMQNVYAQRLGAPGMTAPGMMPARFAGPGMEGQPGMPPGFPPGMMPMRPMPPQPMPMQGGDLPGQAMQPMQPGMPPRPGMMPQLPQNAMRARLMGMQA